MLPESSGGQQDIQEDGRSPGGTLRITRVDSPSSIYSSIDRKDIRAVGINASVQRWKFKKKYAFPPPQLIPLLLAKMRETLGVFILITHLWTKSAWLPEPGLVPVVHTATSTASKSSRLGNGPAQREPFTIALQAQVVNVVVILSCL